MPANVITQKIRKGLQTLMDGVCNVTVELHHVEHYYEARSPIGSNNSMLEQRVPQFETENVKVAGQITVSIGRKETNFVAEMLKVSLVGELFNGPGVEDMGDLSGFRSGDGVVGKDVEVVEIGRWQHVITAQQFSISGSETYDFFIPPIPKLPAETYFGACIRIGYVVRVEMLRSLGSVDICHDTPVFVQNYSLTTIPNLGNDRVGALARYHGGFREAVLKPTMDVEVVTQDSPVHVIDAMPSVLMEVELDGHCTIKWLSDTLLLSTNGVLRGAVNIATVHEHKDGDVNPLCYCASVAIVRREYMYKEQVSNVSLRAVEVIEGASEAGTVGYVRVPLNHITELTPSYENLVGVFSVRYFLQVSVAAHHIGGGHALPLAYACRELELTLFNCR